ncbi:MAG: MFS transporter, partial [Tumebacillaceae bacterium]
MIAFLRSNPRYVRYWASTCASELGDWIRNMTLMFLVRDLSKDSAVAVSYNNFFEFAPIFLLGPYVGVFVDRWDRKRTMLTASLLRAVMIAVLMGAVAMQSMWMIFLVAAISSTFTVFSAPLLLRLSRCSYATRTERP